MKTKGDLSRDKILEVASEIILRDGLSKLSHGGIAEYLTISKSAVHWHFPTKKDLLIALINHYVAHLQTETKRHCAPFIEIGLTEQEAIIPSMYLWYKHFCENKKGWIGLGTALISLYATDPDLIRPIRDWYTDLYRSIALSGLDEKAAFLSMMVFDNCFNSSKFGINALDLQKIVEIQKLAIDLAFKDNPILLAKVRTLIEKTEKNSKKTS